MDIYRRWDQGFRLGERGLKILMKINFKWFWRIRFWWPVSRPRFEPSISRIWFKSLSWLRHYATSRKFAGSIRDEVIGIFSWPNPSSRTMVLGSTQSLTEMSTRNLPGRVKGGRCLRVTASPPSVSRLARKCGSLDVSQTYWPQRPLTGIAIPFLTSHEPVRLPRFLWDRRAKEQMTKYISKQAYPSICSGYNAL
jgi:hypothetical protein